MDDREDWEKALEADDDFAQLEADLESDEEDEGPSGPCNSRGTPWDQLLMEEQIYHSAMSLANMNCIIPELEVVIPRLRKEPNITPQM